MISRELLNIEKLITVDDTGMPKPPSVRQLLDKDVQELYKRDKTPDKSMYIKECGMIYYLGDPKSPAKQQGLTDPEIIKLGIKNFDLPKNYTPDILVLKLAKRYYNDCITEAGIVVETLQQGMHNNAIAIKKLQELMNRKLTESEDVENVSQIIAIIDQLNKKAGEIPDLIKKLDLAYQNLQYETQTQTSRGGNNVSSSMDADEAEDY